MSKQIKRLHKAIYDPIADLQTWRPIPGPSIESLDPFLFLNHHGPQLYPPNNRGLPFGPHPHRGFETLTIILQGDITHIDSVSGQSVINAGGIQWMTAGSGLIHSEVSSETFKKEGGMEEVLQLWFNLPSKYKMVNPNYQGLQAEEIPTVSLDNQKVHLNLFSAKFEGIEGPIDSITNLFTSTVFGKASGTFSIDIPNNNEVFFYVINGQIKINDQVVQYHQLVEFERENETIQIEFLEDSQIILCYGEPFNEPIVAHGPFVMNTRAEISEAIGDYQAGKF